MDAAAIARLRMRAQGLWDPVAAAPEEALRWLVAAQSQEFAIARWSLAQRTARPLAAAVDRAFDDGRILRTHVLRPTWHFVATRDLRWLIGLSGPRVNAVNARRYAELGLDPKTLARANDVIAAAVAGRQMTRSELAEILRRRRIATDGQRIAHILMRAELDAVICSGPMRGKQHTYAAFGARVPSRPVTDRDESLALLARRYFTARGPATLRDFAWWSGLVMADARKALDLARSDLEQMTVDDRTYWLGDEQVRQQQLGLRIDLVQCYDESIISYTESRDVLRAQRVRFPVPRNIEGFVHIILCDGQLLGHWRARPGGKIETRPGRRLSTKERDRLGEAVDRFRAFRGDQPDKGRRSGARGTPKL